MLESSNGLSSAARRAASSATASKSSGSSPPAREKAHAVFASSTGRKSSMRARLSHASASKSAGAATFAFEKLHAVLASSIVENASICASAAVASAPHVGCGTLTPACAIPCAIVASVRASHSPSAQTASVRARGPSSQRSCSSRNWAAPGSAPRTSLPSRLQKAPTWIGATEALCLEYARSRWCASSALERRWVNCFGLIFERRGFDADARGAAGRASCTHEPRPAAKTSTARTAELMELSAEIPDRARRAVKSEL